MEFAIGQNVWLLLDNDPTLNWVEGVIVRKNSRSFYSETYNVAIVGNTIVTDVPSYSEVTNMYVIRPFFNTDPEKPLRTEIDTAYVRTVN